MEQTVQLLVRWGLDDAFSYFIVLQKGRDNGQGDIGQVRVLVQVSRSM